MLTRFARLTASITFPWQRVMPICNRTLSIARTPSAAVCPTLRKAPVSFSFARAYSDQAQSDAVKAVGELVRSHRIVLFMKGNPDDPRCGFSNAVCRILEMHGILDQAKREGAESTFFASYDVLENEELRSAAKVFADWPTFPQVYIDGEFVGGCDILLDMHRSGKLIEELANRGIKSALKDQAKDDQR